MSQRQRFICPFCRETIMETDWPGYDHEVVEASVREHLTERHPIRWRISRKFRRAMKVGHA